MVNAAFGIAVPYDPLADLVPIVQIVDMPTLIAANNDAPYKSMAEMMAWSKANPDRVVPFASAGIGSVPHLWGEHLKALSGAKLEHVGYKGSAEALRDTLAGHVPLLVDALMPTATSVRAGKLRGLAVAMAKRSSLLPDVPTTSESGLVGMEAAVRFGISAPRGTPAELVAQLNAATNTALSDARRSSAPGGTRLHHGRRHAAGLCRDPTHRDRQVAQGHQGLEHPAAELTLG